MTTHHKSEDYKIQAVKYYLVEDNTNSQKLKEDVFIMGVLNVQRCKILLQNVLKIEKN